MKNYNVDTSHIEQHKLLTPGGTEFVISEDVPETFSVLNGRLLKGDRVNVQATFNGGAQTMNIKALDKNFVELSGYGNPFSFINEFCEA